MNPTPSHQPDFSEELRWLQSQQDLLDEVLAEAGRSYVHQLMRRPNARYDLKASNLESYRLSKGQDLCYDRPSIGVVYGLWYHARRVNTSLALSLSLLGTAEGKSVQVYDLGAGTGAVQWALALACAAFEAVGKTPPRLHMVNVDSSPFMLHYLDHLWGQLSSRFSACHYVEYTSQLNTWHHAPVGTSDTWLFTSYLFDHEDKKEALSIDFDRLVARIKPQQVVVSTSAQSKKIAFLDAIGKRLEAADFVARHMAVSAPFKGSLPSLNKVRATLQQQVRSMRPAASWDDYSFTGRIYARRQLGLAFELDAPRNEKGDLSLFMPHITERLEIHLSPEQQNAANHDNRPTLIHGPAGCGKSIVITERIRNLVEERQYDPELRILVTTFNRSLIKKVLYKWLRALLDTERVRWRLANNEAGETCYLGQFEGSSKPNIFLLHFDVLPTRLGMVHHLETASHVAHGASLLALAERSVIKAEELLKAQGFAASDIKRVLDPVFILDEYHRVYYGLYRTSEEKFLTRPRPGRPRFVVNSKPRQALWECLKTFLEELTGMNGTTFTARRKRFFELLKPNTNLFPELLRGVTPAEWNPDEWVKKELNKIKKYKAISGLLPSDYIEFFSHVFVDEMQDCTQTDYAIFYRLLADPNELIVAGDLAQAVHMGRSASSILPRLNGGQKNRRTHELQGSYRLPFRISEAVVPLSQRIFKKRESCKDKVRVSLQNPYRGSPPGARPIVVWARDEHRMATKIHAIYTAYSESLGTVGFELGRCSILESDSSLRSELSEIGMDAETNTILRLKGLEKTCVVWSTRVFEDTEDDVEEYVYTILTRSAALLIIALFPNTHTSFYPILNTFEKDRIIIWDQDTEVHFDAFCVDRPLSEGIEEHDDVSL